MEGGVIRRQALDWLVQCAMRGSCACLWDPETGLLYKGCPCKKGRECMSGRCRRKVCR